MVFLHEIQFSLVVSQFGIHVTGIRDKAVATKFVLRTLNMAGKSFDYCLSRCLEECLCKSFQVCGQSECELSSIDKSEDQSKFRTRLGCVYYDLDPVDVSITS